MLKFSFRFFAIRSYLLMYKWRKEESLRILHALDVLILRKILLTYLRIVLSLSLCVAIWNGFRVEDRFIPDGMAFEEWLLRNLQAKRKEYNGLPWPLVFIIWLWFTWKWRCKGVFEQNCVMPSEPHQFIFQYALEWFNVVKPLSPTSLSSMVHLYWIAPIIANSFSLHLLLLKRSHRLWQLVKTILNSGMYKHCTIYFF